MDVDIPVEYCLSGNEADEIDALTAELRRRGEDPATAQFYDRCRTAAARMPRGLRSFVEDFRGTEPASAALIHGFTVDDAAIGPTPTHWETSSGASTAPDQELQLALCGLLLGEPFAWATLQDSRLVQNILPVPGDETCQNGYGSSALLEFHTEDGFHPDRCDYLLLLGVRNDDKVPTITASVRNIELSAQDRAILGQRRFEIMPDDEHVRQLEARAPGSPALEKMRHLMHNPELAAVLFSDQVNPYLRIDFPFMRCAGTDGAAEAALRNLMSELERAQRDVVVGPGTLLVIDNYLAVHGRRSFRARYDGTDRWLKKLTVSRDPRRGDAAGSAVGDRVRM